LNAAADVAARASLADLPALQENVQRLTAERERLERELARFFFLKPYPSRTNFVLCGVEGITALQLRQALAVEGVIVRYYHKPDMQNFVRISAGTPEQTDKLLGALRKIGADHDRA
jgi:histidinol-phosphate aminotransferase